MCVCVYVEQVCAYWIDGYITPHTSSSSTQAVVPTQVAVVCFHLPTLFRSSKYYTQAAVDTRGYTQVVVA
jgi:hypothetical protein